MEAKVMDGSSDLEVIDLRSSVSILIAKYLQNHKPTNSENLHAIVMGEVEASLLETTILHCGYNQMKASKILGINRVTLRTRLRKYFADKYCGKRVLDLSDFEDQNQ